MKKNGIWIILLFIISVAIFGAYLCYDRVIKDTTPPVVICDSEVLEVSVKASEQDLLAGVRATDEASGDVSNSLVIEQISALVAGERIITYAAVDGKGNVGRAQRVLKYTDYKPPTFRVSGKMRFPVGTKIDPLKYISAESALDGNLTSKIKYTLPSGLNTSSEGKYEAEFRVSDSAGTVTYKSVTIEIYNPLNENQ